MTDTQFICDIDVLDDPGARGFSLCDAAGSEVNGFVVRSGDRVFAYVDSCPHRGVSLAWLPDQYLDVDGIFIQCAMHGALFTLDEGLCVHGPCVGQRLKRLAVRMEGRHLKVATLASG